MTEAPDNTISLAEARRRQRASEQIEMPDPSPAEGLIPLGHDRGVYYYLSRSGKQIAALKADQHTRLALCGLASGAQYWERQQQFRSDKGTLDWGIIADWLMDACRRRGIYDPDIVRGRGAWIDAGRSVLHLGDRLIVDGAPTSLELENSGFVYEAARSLRISAEPPLDVLDARKLLRITAALRWERPVSSKLLAGWIAIAPICGALAWRPAVWITGAAGSGKSWIGENIIAPTVGPLAVSVQSKTSEAGLRQLLGSDARPVMFDEAEREDHASAARMQQVLDLVRQATSESGAEIIKGSANQSAARRYRIRSAFLFQSINVGLQHQADESRVTILALKDGARRPSEADAQAFADLKVWVAETLTPAYSAALVARSVRMIQAIRASAEVFAQAIASTVGTRRQGDQLGTLLAGAWSLNSDNVVTLEQAKAYVAKEEFAETIETTDDGDDIRCLRHLMAHRIRLNGSEYPIGALIEAVRFTGYERPPGMLARDTADQALRFAGIAVKERSRTDSRAGIFISTNHSDIKRALRETPWDAGWSRTLGRIEGAEHGRAVTCRFTSTSMSRAVWIPIEVVEGDVSDA